MKFTASVVLAVAAASSTVSAFAPVAFAPRTATTSTRIFQSTEAASETEEVKKLTKKEERLRMINDDQFYRRGFKEVRDESLATMNEQFESTIVKDLKTNNYVMERDGVKVFLAKVCSKMKEVECNMMHSEFSLRFIFSLLRFPFLYLFQFFLDSISHSPFLFPRSPLPTIQIYILGLWLLLGRRTEHRSRLRGGQSFPRPQGPYYQRVDSQPGSQRQLECHECAVY
jgi:hypothetical protein